MADKMSAIGMAAEPCAGGPADDLAERLAFAESLLAANNASLATFHFAASALLASAFSDAETLYEMVLGLGCNIVQAARGAVYLRGASPVEFELRAGRGPAPERIAVPDDGRLLEHVLRSRSAVLCSGPGGLRPDLTVSDALHDWLGESFCVVPLVVNDQTLGLLCMAGKTVAGGFTKDDMRFFTAYSGLAASAVHNATLMTELRTKERLEKEMEIARTIQTSLLPGPVTLSNFALAAAMLPAEQVGGDFYDFHRCSDGFWLGVGDVSSHGVTPGLIMMMAQSILSTLVTVNSDATPSDLFTQLNRVIYDNVQVRLRTDDYMTLMLGRCYQDGRFVHSGAHLDILVRRKRSGLVERHPTSGVWAGVMPDVGSVTVDTELRLEPGDVMLLYTDGLTEARNPAGELLGGDRLAALLESLGEHPVEAIRDAVFEYADRWALEQQDDRTAIVVRYLGTQK